MEAQGDYLGDVNAKPSGGVSLTTAPICEVRVKPHPVMQARVSVPKRREKSLIDGSEDAEPHSVAVRLNEQLGTKRWYAFIQANRAWLPKFLVFWIMLMAVFSNFVYNKMDAANKERREEVLVSMCDQ
ncbi:hypothetical protein PVL29_000632 [Vitis rotundifolia]|uniref:Uncharacterized protein n=1 Tax=Vitis rotundifolia TaxID=103349 RepID=A0AA39AJC5_VITRO|nr:hypothetical protein PVL29_000632 [Vitis rotundifolia]